jgi:hypothetical protein
MVPPLPTPIPFNEVLNANASIPADDPVTARFHELPLVDSFSMGFKLFILSNF